MKLEHPGDMSPPVKTSFGSHVIYLIDVSEAVDQSFEEVRDIVGRKELPFWIKGQFTDLVEDLRESTFVEGYVGDVQRRKTR